MLILLRQIRMRGERIVDQRDLELDTAALRVGSGKGQDLQLFGDGIGAEHAVLRPQAGGRLRIDTRGGGRIRVDGQDVARAELAPDEWARIGPHRLAPVAAPPGFDAAVEVRIDADAAQSIKDRLRSELTLKLPRVRRHAYGLALLVLLVGLAFPMAGYFDDRADATIERFGGPTDDLWSSGPLASAHHVPGIADDCNACHVEPFKRVSDETCIGCHERTTAHFAPAHPLTEEFDGACRDCHREHNEPSNLIVRDKGQCTDCHARAMRRLADAAPAVDGMPVARAPDEVRPVTAFTAGGHPDFLASVLRPADDPADGERWRVHRQPLDGADAHESSRLKFPHDIHLDADKVSLADGPSSVDRALACDDCHSLEKEGEHFRAVTMEDTCAGCHSLAFDDAQPDRQLPHGEPATLRTHLEEYYVRQAAIQRRAEPPRPARRVPDEPITRRCEGEPLDCGREWADAEMDKLFTKAGCVSCHEVERGDDEWTVAPVKLVRDWFPAARFDHRPHLNPGARADGETCLGCHEATASSHSEDILMPGIDNCVTCHAEDRPRSVALQCVDCHSFHRPGMALMGEH